MSDLPEGKVKLHVDAREKIGLPNYSSVDIGASLTRMVDDAPNAELLEELQAMAHEVVEAFISEERKAVLTMVQNK